MSTQRKLYQRIASTLGAIENCKRTGNTEWEARHAETVQRLVHNHMPSGAGIDNGTHIYDESKPNRLVFATSYHHINDSGMYDGWTDHTVVVTPNLACDFDLRVTGRDRNQIKDYLADIFAEALRAEVANNTTVDGRNVSCRNQTN